MLGNTGLHVDLREARTNRCDKRGGRIDGRDGLRPQAFDELRSQCSRSAPDVQRPMARLCADNFRELHRQRLGIPTHELGVGVRSHVEGHRINVCLGM